MFSGDDEGDGETVTSTTTAATEVVNETTTVEDDAANESAAVEETAPAEADAEATETNVVDQATDAVVPEDAPDAEDVTDAVVPETN